jgi:hypothetical protein
MEDFLVWSLSLQPQIYEHAAFSRVVSLGIFAWRYQISALSNQVTDMIRRNLANGPWQLEASIVDDVYEATPIGSPLREVIRAALGGLPRSSVDDEGPSREKWKMTFLKHSQFGWDYIEARGSEWTPQDYLSEPCRFHDHQGVFLQEESAVPQNQCAYAQEECFPRWEEETMKGQEMDGEQERCGPDEERKWSNDTMGDEVKEPAATEVVVNGVAKEAVEPAADDVVMDPVVNGKATEAVEPVEPVVNGVATEVVEPGEPVVDGATTEAVEAVKAVADDKETDPVVNGVTMELASVTTEASAADDMATEASVTTETADVGMMTEAVEPETDNAPTEVGTEAVEPVIDDVAPGAAVTETMVAKEVVVDGVGPQTAIESKDEKNGVAEEEKARKKRKKKKKAAGTGQG